MPPTAQCWRVSRTNWASLRREQRRPEAVLLSRRRGGGRLPVVSRCRSFWEWCHTRTNRRPPRHPCPHTSQRRGSGHGCTGREKNGTPTTEQLDSPSWMSSFWTASKEEASQNAPDVCAVSVKSLCRAQQQQHCLHKNKV